MKTIPNDTRVQRIIIESFNGKLRNELLNREIFTTLMEAKVLIEYWRREYNEIRPHSFRGAVKAADHYFTGGTMIGGRSPSMLE